MPGTNQISFCVNFIQEVHFLVILNNFSSFFSLNIIKICTAKGPLIYYVKVFGGFLEPPISLRKALFTTQSKGKLPFSQPPRPLCPNVI